MKTAALLVLAIAAVATPSSVRAAVIDDFTSPTLSAAYTQTAVLDQGATRNVAYGVNATSSTLQAVSNGTDGAEQVLLLRSDFTLGVGQVLRADVNVSGVVGGNPATSGLSQDLAIAISATATPTITTLGGGDRKDYFFVGFRGDATHLISSGFNGTTGLGTNQVFGLNITGVYIQRDSATQFEVGYETAAGPDISAFTYTVANTNIGNAIGFYTDMRASNTIGQLDNLRIEAAAPEPTSLALLALAAPALLRRRR